MTVHCVPDTVLCPKNIIIILHYSFRHRSFEREPGIKAHEKILLASPQVSESPKFSDPTSQGDSESRRTSPQGSGVVTRACRNDLPRAHTQEHPEAGPRPATATPASTPPSGLHSAR